MEIKNVICGIHCILSNLFSLQVITSLDIIHIPRAYPSYI